jgi:hypothetical protein
MSARVAGCAIVCRNGVGSDSLFNLYEARAGARPAGNHTHARPTDRHSAAGISPEAFFSPDGNFLAVNLNTWPGLTDTRGGLAVVADEPLATPVLLTRRHPAPRWRCDGRRRRSAGSFSSPD